MSTPGSLGEHALQKRYGTASRARSFYDHQVLDYLNGEMQDFIRRMEMMFVATADTSGAADCSFRAGPPGFVAVLDERTVVYPEYRGNGVMASLGNITERGHVGLLFIDFCGDRVGLHINGHAAIVETEPRTSHRDVPVGPVNGLVQKVEPRPERWVEVSVVEAYIHCSKHIPALVRADEHEGRAWGTDDPVRKGGDRFHAKHCARPWVVTCQIIWPLLFALSGRFYSNYLAR